MAPSANRSSRPPTAAGEELLCMLDWAAHFRDHTSVLALARAAYNADLSLPVVTQRRAWLAGLEDVAQDAKNEEDFDSVLNTIAENEDWLLRGVQGHDLFDLKLKIRRQLVLSPLRNSLPDDLDSVSAQEVGVLNNERYWQLLDKIFPLETSRRASLSGSDAGDLASPGARQEGGYRKVVEVKERKQLLDVRRGDGSPGGGDRMDMHKVLYLLRTYSKEGFLAEVGQFTRRVESKLLPDPEPFEAGEGGGGGGGGGGASSLLGRDPRTALSAAGRARARLQDWSRASGLVSTKVEQEATESKIRGHANALRRAAAGGGGGAAAAGTAAGGRGGGRRKEQEDEDEEETEDEEQEEEDEELEESEDAQRLANNLRKSTKTLQKGLRERGLLNVRGNAGGAGGGGGGGGGGPTTTKKRLYDPARKGRSITFEDSQYAGSESDEEGEEEDNIAASEARRRAAARQRRAHEAAAAAAARLADRDKKSQKKKEQVKSKPAAAPPAAVSGKRSRDVEEEEEEEEGEEGGREKEQEEEIQSTTESTNSSSSEDEDDDRERVRALKRGGGGRVLVAKKKSRLQVQPSGRSKRQQPKTHRTFWSAEEVADLKRAVLHDGMKGRWADILNSPKYPHLEFKLRTSVDLKDKWRGLERKAAAKGVTVDEVN